MFFCLYEAVSENLCIVWFVDLFLFSCVIKTGWLTTNYFFLYFFCLFFGEAVLNYFSIDFVDWVHE